MHAEVKLFDDLDAVAADAGSSLDRDAQPRLFDRLDWFRLVARHIPGVRPVVVRARAGDDTAWLFLSDRGGGRADALGCWYTLGFAPVFAGGRGDLLLAAIAKAARARFWGIALAPVGEADRGGILRAFAATGWHAAATVATVNRFTVVEGDFDRWWAARPGRLRNTVRRKAKATDFRIEIADGFDPALWAAYEDVYAQSWKGSEGAPAMLRALAVSEGAAGTLRLGVAFQDDSPVAAQFWLVENRRATIHKLAHVHSARAGSPGTVLTAAMFRHVINRDRPAEIDFGTGDDPYKADWMDDVRTLWRVELFKPTDPRALARVARSWAGSLVRRGKAG